MLRLLYLYIMLLAFNCLSAQHATVADTSQLKDVIVTTQAAKTTPVTFINLNLAELKQTYTAQEPSFVLAQTPGITAYSDAGSMQGYSYFRIRGIDQTRINITLDGMPLNEPEDQGAYFSNYPDLFNSVSKIQIQRGVGTSKSGIASFGGSIQLSSPSFTDTSVTNLGIGFGSYGSMWGHADYNSGIKSNKGFYISASQVYSAGYKHSSSNNSQSLFASGWLLYKKNNFKLNLLLGHQQNQLAWLGVSDSIIRQDRRTNANENERDRFTQCLVQLQNNYWPHKRSALHTSVYYTFLKGSYDFNLNGFLGLPTTSELYNYAFQSHLAGASCSYSFFPRYIDWTTGIQGNVYNRQHLGSEKALGVLYKNNGYKYETSAFSKLNFTYKWFTLYVDLQYRFASFGYKGTAQFKTIHWHFFNPKAGISFTPTQNTVLYYSVGQTGREPTRNDMFGGNDDLLSDSNGTGIISITTPEYNLDHELGLRYQGNKLTLGFNLYYMDFKNEIVLNGKFGPNGLALTNKVKRSYRTGVELNLAYKINPYVSLNNNSAFNYSRIQEQNEVFTPILTPMIIINQNVVFSYKNASLTISGRYQHQSFLDFANCTKINSYFLLNASLGYTIHAVQFGITLNNLTNANYFNNGYVDYDGTAKYFVQAPLNFYTSIKYSF